MPKAQPRNLPNTSNVTPMPNRAAPPAGARPAPQPAASAPQPIAPAPQPAGPAYIGDNVLAQVDENGMLWLCIDLNRPENPPSQSGKTLLLGNTHGAQLVNNTVYNGLKVSMFVSVPNK